MFSCAVHTYLQEFWFWECLNVLYKCLLNGVLTVIAPGTPLQVFAALLICTVYLLSVFKFQPYVENTADRLASFTCGSLFATYLLGFYEATAKFYKTSGGDNSGNSSTALPNDVLGPLLITINAIPLGYFVVSNIWYLAVVAQAAKKKNKKKNSNKKKNKNNIQLTSVAPVAHAAGVDQGKNGALASSESTTTAHSADDIRSWESW